MGGGGQRSRGRRRRLGSDGAARAARPGNKTAQFSAVANCGLRLAPRWLSRRRSGRRSQEALCGALSGAADELIVGIQLNVMVPQLRGVPPYRVPVLVN